MSCSDDDLDLCDTPPETRIELLVFSFGRELYAYRATDIVEIFRAHTITRVPTAPAFVIGVTSLRGTITPIVDIGAKLTEVPFVREKGQIKLAILKGPRGPVGAPAGDNIRFVSVPESAILPKPVHLPSERAVYIDAVAPIDGAFVSILNVEELLNSRLTAEAS